MVGTPRDVLWDSHTNVGRLSHGQLSAIREEERASACEVNMPFENQSIPHKLLQKFG